MSSIQFKTVQEAKTYFDQQEKNGYQGLTVANLGRSLTSVVKMHENKACSASEFLSLNPERLVTMLSQSAKQSENYQSGLKGLVSPLRQKVKSLASQARADVAVEAALQNQSKELSGKIELLEFQISDLIKKNHDLAHNLELSGETQEKIIRESRKTVAEKGKEIERLAIEITRLNRQVEALKIEKNNDLEIKKTEEPSIQIKELQRMVNKFLKENRGLKETNCSLEKTHDELNKELEKLKEELTSKENTIKCNEQKILEQTIQIQEKDGIIARLENLLNLCISFLKDLAGLLGVSFNDLTPDNCKNLSAEAKKTVRFANIELGRREKQKNQREAEAAKRKAAREEEERKAEQVRLEKQAEANKIAQEKAQKLAEEKAALKIEKEEREQVVKQFSYADAVKASLLPQPEEKEEIEPEAVVQPPLVIDNATVVPVLTILTGLAQVAAADLDLIQQAEGSEQKEPKAEDLLQKRDSSIFAPEKKQRKRNGAQKRIEKREEEARKANNQEVKDLLFPKGLPNLIQVQQNPEGKIFVENKAGEWTSLEDVINPPSTNSWFSWLWGAQ